MASTDPTETVPDNKRFRRVIIATSVGQFVEFYDFGVYGFTAVQLGNHFFPATNDAASLLYVFAVFGVSFAMRPLGGLVFGRIADRFGRRAVLTWTVTLMGAATALIGLLPTYASIGLIATILLILLRLFQGLSAGGEAPSGVAFLLEHAPKRVRAFWVNVAIAMSSVASAAGSIFVFILSTSMATSNYETWGWRIPYLVAFPLALVGLYIRLRTEESPAFQDLQTTSHLERHPIRVAFTTQPLNMLRVVFIIGFSGLAFYFLVTYLVSYLETTVELSNSLSLIFATGSLLVFAILLPIAGVFADRFGRKPLMISGGLVIIVLTVPGFALISTGSITFATIGLFLITISVAWYGGGSYTWFAEIFPPDIRATASGISYNVGYALLGGTGPYLATYLTDVSGTPLAPGIYLSIMALVAVLFVISAKESATDTEIHPR